MRMFIIIYKGKGDNMNPRVSIVSFDYDGTLTNPLEFKLTGGLERYKADLEELKKILSLMKTYEGLDKIYFCLNTTENRYEILHHTFDSMFNETGWLMPGIQFLHGKPYSYDVSTKEMTQIEDEFSVTKYNGDKLKLLEIYALATVANDEELVSVTHVEDGKNYPLEALDALEDIGVDTHIINLPMASMRAWMLASLLENINSRQDKQNLCGNRLY